MARNDQEHALDEFQGSLSSSVVDARFRIAANMILPENDAGAIHAKLLVDTVSRKFPVPLDGAAPLWQQFMFAGLARCLALLDGMYELHRGQIPDGIPILARSAIETAIVGFYGWFGGDVAVERLQRYGYLEARRNEERMLEQMDPGASPLIVWEPHPDLPGANPEEPTPKNDRLTVRDIYMGLQAELDRRQERGLSELFKVAYISAYAANSNLGTHASFGSIMVHRRDEDGALRVERSSIMLQPEMRGNVAMLIDEVRVLAWHYAYEVYRSRRWDREELEALADPGRGGRPVSYHTPVAGHRP